LLWEPGLLLYVGRGGLSDSHKHHSVQLAVAFDAPFELVVEDRALVAQAAIVPSGAAHAFDTGNGRIFYALVEPHGPVGAPLAQRARELVGRDIAEMIDPGEPLGEDAASLVSYGEAILASLGRRAVRRCSPSAPVLAALDYLDAALEGRPRLPAAAAAAHISPSRLTHLFSQEMGIPFRRLVLWLRLRRAAEHAPGCSTLTEAAIAAGFSDMAHLSRVCHATFGVTPAVIRHMTFADEPRPRS
jgi:AraC-like DNA-binding protein